MRAIALDSFGSPDVLHSVTLPELVPGEHDLLVEVYATSINPVDTKIRAGGMGKSGRFPMVLGFDVSGVVRATGAAVAGFKPGDEVYGSPSLTRPGADAEFVCIDARTAALKPRTLDHPQAAAMPLVTLTAWESLYDRARLAPGQTVLIQGGGGGVGHIAVQLAKIRGCRVIATAGRKESIALARQCRADEVIDYTSQNIVERVKQETAGKGCDVVFDTVGGQAWDSSLDCPAVNGHIVAILPNDLSRAGAALFFKNVSMHFEFMGAQTMFKARLQHQGDILREAAQLVDGGQLKPHVSRVISLDELPAGHRQLETGHTLGKVAVRVKA